MKDSFHQPSERHNVQGTRETELHYCPDNHQIRNKWLQSAVSWTVYVTQPSVPQVWKPLSVSRVWNVHGTCLSAVPLLFFLHRHDDVTPSRFRALESYVLRVLDGNEIKLWSSPSLSVFTVFVDLFFIHTISVGLISGCSIEKYFCCRFIVQRHW